MSTAQFTVHTSLAPADALELLTDFGPDRAKRWPNIDADHFRVHAEGDDWAEVTEGTAMGWERERYSWDRAAGTVVVDTLDSNLWGPGSSWHYELKPAGTGTDVSRSWARVLSAVSSSRCCDTPRRSDQRPSASALRLVIAPIVWSGS
jgi:hypothetical protein